MGKFTVIFEAESAPKLFLDQVLPNIGKVVELKSEELPHRVDTRWVMERYGIARTTVIELLKTFNKGTGGKCSYDPLEIIPILDNRDKSKRGAKRKK